MSGLRFISPLFLILPLLSLQACQPLVKKPVVTSAPPVRVLLAQIYHKDSIEFSGNYVLQSEEARYQFGKRNRKLMIQPLSDGIHLYNQNRNLLYRNNSPVILDPADGQSSFRLRGHEYSGRIYFQAAGENSVYIINQLSLENYLKGVVPAEIPTLRAEDYEAIKAQAICARTYAYRHLNNGHMQPFDLKATVEDQVYSGLDNQSRLANQAIEETKGVVITYQGKPATIFYHSTCGGRLETAANIWPERNETYLAGGYDAMGDFFSCSASPYFRWLQTTSLTHLDSLFIQQFGRGSLDQTVNDTTEISLQIQVLKRNTTGRVSELQITYADTTVLLNGYQIRRFLADQQGRALPSNLFYLTQENDSTLLIHGGGFGHGVGMCQYGALNMARRGFKHYHIISKYFPGTKLLREY